MRSSHYAVGRVSGGAPNAPGINDDRQQTGKNDRKRAETVLFGGLAPAGLIATAKNAKKLARRASLFISATWSRSIWIEESSLASLLYFY